MSFNLRALRFIQGVLLILCMSFVAFTAYELVRPYRFSPAVPLIQDEPVVADATVAMAESATGETIPPLTAFSELIERPLFMANRRPFVPPPTAPKGHAPGRESAEQILLSAIVITDEQRLALVYSDRDEKLQQLRQGEVFRGWTLTKLQANGIFLKNGKRTRYVRLTFAPSRSASREQRERPAINPVAMLDRSTKGRRMKHLIRRSE